jgi:GTP-binding protein
VNFFQVNDDFILVDLPGYGYARVSKTQREGWRPLIEGYVQGSPHLRGLVLLLDSRREPSTEDREMLDFLADVGLPTLVAITKMDKFGPAAGAERVAAIVAELELDAAQVVPVSGKTGMGRDDLAEAVVSLAKSAPWR